MSDYSIGTYLKEAENKITKQLWFSVRLFLVAFAVLVSAYFSFLMPESENPAGWFQRSGSIAVIFAVWIESGLLSIRGDVIPSGSADITHIELGKKYSPYYRFASFLAVSLAIVGTIIWGYGDIFY